MGIRMVCEFLPSEYKKKLLELASIEELVQAGYKLKGAYTAKERGILSDERCEKLVIILKDKARDILYDALHQFESQLRELYDSHGDKNE